MVNDNATRVLLLRHFSAVRWLREPFLRINNKVFRKEFPTDEQRIFGLISVKKNDFGGLIYTVYANP